MKVEAVVMMLGVVSIAAVVGHSIYDLIKSSKEKKMQEAMEEAAKFAMLKQGHQTHLYQQQQQMMAQQNMSAPWINGGRRSHELDLYERTQLALVQLQSLFLAGELEKQELLNATKMAASVDRENLTIVEEIIKTKLG